MNVLKSIGVMQGRLLPKYKGKYQAHPKGYWQNEFKIAKSIGISHIQFLFDNETAEENPIIDEKQFDKILSLELKTKINIESICCDYFINNPLFFTEYSDLNKNTLLLDKLIEAARALNIRTLVIPCLENSSLDNHQKYNSFIKTISKFKNKLEKFNVKLSLESDLSIPEVLNLMKELSSSCYGVNYDIGNSAGYNRDPEAEVMALKNYIQSIHVKDRNLDGISVPLGKGNADFDKSFHALSKIDYSGNFVFETYRDDEGLKIFKEQLEWVLPIMNKHFN